MNEPPRGPMRVLLATDDSDAARNAEAWVARARWGVHCVVDVLCVAGPGITRFGWGMQTYRTAVKEAVEQLRQGEVVAAERVANEVGQRLQGTGFVTNAWARQGDAAEEILAALEVERPELVAVGPRGRSGLAQFLLGSVSRRIIAESERPVLVARQPSTPAGALPGSMLLLVDGTLAIEAAIDWLEAAGWARDARITLLGLLGLPPGWEHEDPALVDPVTAALREDVTDVLDRLGGRLADGAAGVRTAIEIGHPHEGALRLAGELGVDLIVVGRPTGRAGHDPFAEKVARYAPCSVLVVPGSWSGRGDASP